MNNDDDIQVYFLIFLLLTILNYFILFKGEKYYLWYFIFSFDFLMI
jgi:hypothetical protein